MGYQVIINFKNKKIMATKPSWLTVSPMSGSGNDTLQNTASVHTGRLVRTGTVTVTAVGVSLPKTYSVTQEAKAEFISIDNGSSMAAEKGGGTVTVTGKSNSAALTFAWVGDDHEATIAAKYTAGGKQTNNSEAITGDPGGSAEYSWSVELTLPANTTVEQIDRTLKISNGSSISQQIVIEQTAGDATLSLSEDAITIPADGSAVSVTVTSNTSWTVS